MNRTRFLKWLEEQGETAVGVPMRPCYCPLSRFLDNTQPRVKARHAVDNLSGEYWLVRDPHRPWAPLPNSTQKLPWWAKRFVEKVDKLATRKEDEKTGRVRWELPEITGYEAATILNSCKPAKREG